jgi:hypothetical protein
MRQFRRNTRAYREYARHLPMSSAYYPLRKGEYVYNVTVTKDEAVLLSRRYRARLSNAERIGNRRLMLVRVNVPDMYGPTVSEAMRALGKHFGAWRRARCERHSVCWPQPLDSSTVRLLPQQKGADRQNTRMTAQEWSGKGGTQ